MTDHQLGLQIVWNKEKQKSYIYVNGVLRNMVDAPGDLRFASSGCNWFAIGGDPASATTAHGSWKGDVAIARAYDKPLTSEEVALLWKNIPTGIEAVRDSQFTIHNGEAIYDLQGRRIKNDESGIRNLPKGLYIVNGKKMLVK